MSLPNLSKALSIEFLATQHDQKKLSVCQKLKYIFTHITLEPLVLLYVLPCIMDHLTTQNLYLEKACRVNLNYNTSICDALAQRNKSGYDQFHEMEVQRLVSKMVALRAMFIGSLPAILMLFIGSWSDRHGKRKVVILVPLCGEICSCACMFVCAYFLLGLPMEVAALSESIPTCLTGTWFCAFLGMYSYISGISSEEDKTIRIGAVSMCQNIGITVGVFLSGFLLKPLGFQGVYAFSGVMLLSGLVYGLFVLKDKETFQEKTVAKVSFIKDFFDFEHVKGTFRICFQEGAENRKSKMIVIMFISMMVMGPFYGEFTVLYLYTRLRFAWNEVDYSVYNTTHFLIQIVGSIFALTFFSKYLKLDDAMLGIIALISKMASCFVYAFAPSWEYFYLGAIVEIFHGTAMIALRSLMAKIVSSHELGQSNSVFGICEAVMPLAFGPLYTTMYNYFIHIFPGTFYLVSAALYVITLSLFVWMYKENRRDRRLREEMEKNIDQEENLLKKACFNEIKKSMEKLKSTQSLHNH